MTPTRQGSFRLFRFAGVDVFLHWSWFVVAWWDITSRGRSYSSLKWNVLEYLSLFATVLMHEFGHALACRQVGGHADQIVLWPLGGVAYVDPPQRPGAMLCSIAAGPLVNVALFPILMGAWLFAGSAGWPESFRDGYLFLRTIAWINIGLLVFNLVPIYPLDGGQIFRSLLWFVIGRARSLMVATVVGFIGVSAFLIYTLYLFMSPGGRGSVWLFIVAVFVLLNCWRGLMVARILLRLAKAPRHEGFACPQCQSAPPIGAYWGCAKCRTAFDTFETQATCPGCGTQFAVTRCPDCGASSPITEWLLPAAPPPKIG